MFCWFASFLQPTSSGSSSSYLASSSSSFASCSPASTSHTHTSSACFMMAEHDKLVAVAAGGFLQRAHLKRLASETQYRPRLRAKPSAGSIRTSQLCCGGCRLAGRATASMNSWEPRGERGSMESGGQTRGEKRPNMSRHDDSRPQTYLRRARAHGRQKERESAE